MPWYFHTSVVAALLWVTVISTATAQQASFKHLGPETGFLSNQAYCVQQDEEGYIWVATDRGVARYNGYRFERFNTNDGLTDYEVFQMELDSKGRLWMLPYSFAPCFFEGGKFHNETDYPAFRRFRSGSSWSKLFFEDSKGNIYLGGQRADSLYVLPPSLDRVTAYDFDAEVIWEQDGQIKGMSRWLKTFDISSGEVVQLTGFTVSKSGFMKVIPWKEGLRVLIEISGQLWLYDPNSEEFELFCDLPKTDNLQVLSLLIESEGWLIGTNKGLFRFDPEHRTFKLTAFDQKRVSFVFRDHEDNLWVTAIEGGVYVQVNRGLDIFPELVGVDVEGLVRSTDSSAYILTRERQTGIWKTGHPFQLLEGATLSIGTTRDIFTRQDGTTYLLGTRGTALIREAKVVEVYPAKFRGMYPLGDDHVLVQLAHRSLVVRTDQISNLVSISSELAKGWQNKLPRAQIRTIDQQRLALAEFILPERTGRNIMGRDSILWINTLHGLTRFQTEQGQLHLIDTVLPIRRLTQLAASSSQSEVWAGTYNQGIFRIRQDEFLHLSQKDGLVDNNCQGMCFDNDGHLWIGTGQGLSKLDTASLTFTNFYESDGLLHNQINDLLFVDDQLLIASSGGLMVTDPKDIRKKQLAPKMRIKRVSVNNRPLASDSFLLHHSDNNVKIDYIAISPASVGNITYRHQLRGFDQQWTRTTARSVHYYALPPGEFDFVVQAAGSDGTWSESVSWGITILTPWWETWWFRIGAGLVILLSMWWIINRRIRLRTQKRETLLRLNESRLIALRSRINPHFLFNSMQSIQQFILANEKEAGVEYLGKFGQLMRLILDQADRPEVTIGEEVRALTLYLELEQLRLQNRFDFVIHVSKSIEPTWHSVPTFLIQPYVENAIWHGVMPKKQGGIISLDFGYQDEQVTILISDDGVGRNGSTTNLHPGSESKGQALTQERIDLLNANRSGSIRLEINDLHPGQTHPGTQVKLTLPQ